MENKVKMSGDSSNITGQLMAEMEKVAGDLASIYLQDTAVPDEKKEFQYIELIGFVTDFAKSICKVYKLVMDFYNSKSTLYSGEQELESNDALNRLILTLEQNEEQSWFDTVP